MNSEQSQIVCKIDSQTLRETLEYSADFFSTTIPFDEAEIIQIYKKASTEDKEQVYQKLLQTPLTVENPSPPFPSELCLPAIRAAVTLLSQILGLDVNSEVTETMMGFFLYLDRPGTAPLRFDDYLIKEISFQLANFSKIYHFRYQAYLYALVIHAKREALAIIDPVTFKKWPPTVPFYHAWPYAQFIDLIILSIFRVFNPELSRISKDLREILNPELIGDWFLAKSFSLVRVFGFTGSPYVLPIFLTTSVFSLEVMRQRISADKEHFTAPTLKRSSWIKYPLTVGNFILKREATLPIIEQVLKQFNFPQASPLNYDPKQIISQRRQEYNRGPFQHSQISNLGEEANSLLYDHVWISEPIEEMVQARNHVDFSEFKSTQGEAEQTSTRKRSEPEVTNMDIEQSEASKKQKITSSTEVIDIDMIEEPFITPTIVEEETSQAMVETTSANPEAGNKMPSTPVLRYRKYNYAAAAEDEFKNKQSLLTHYKNQRKESVVQAQKQLSDLIQKSDEKVTLMTVRDAATGSLSLAITDEEKASEIRLEMDQLSASDKIWFHK
jgi:hypothetical protein